MGKKTFNFWQDHSLHYLEMAFRTDRCEIVENPDAYGKNKGQCGDTVEIFLTIKGNRIQYVSFITDGCINTRACANTVATLAGGKTMSEAWGVTKDKVVDYLETLPEEFEHCAELAVGAFYLALANYREIKQKPWKKFYQKNF